jgi:Mg-chelatase subunit ChlD
MVGDTKAVGTLSRWRLVLGKTAEEHGVGLAPGQGHEQVDEVCEFLFDGDGEGNAGGDDDDKGAAGGGGRRGGGRRGGRGGGHPLTVPSWIDAVHELFPRAAREVLERELVQRRGIEQLLEQPRLLEKVEPNVELVKTLLTHKDLLNPKTRVLARKVIDKVVSELRERIKVQVETAIVGAIRRDRHSPRRVFRNLDLRTTIRRNLHNYDHDRGQLIVDRMFFHAAERNKRPWHIMVVVDQSGSMLDSAIFSAIMASIFHELPAVKTSLLLFDTEVVDLSDQVGQPVDVLLKVQLGGGTNIAKALRYAQQQLREPARTIVVLITDFYEGGPETELVRVTRELSQSGVRTIGLGALGYDARPAYNRNTAAKLRKVGMDVLVCTPETLAECMGRIIRG